MIQRLGSHDGSRSNQIQTSNEPLTQPISWIQPKIQAEDPNSASLRSSRLHGQLSDAIKLDQSLNYQELMQLQMNQAQGPNVTNQNPQTRPQSFQQNPLLGTEDDVMKRRRELERKQRNQDYNEYLAKLAPYYQSQAQPTNHSSAPHSAQQSRHPIPNLIQSNPLDLQSLPHTAHAASAKNSTNTSSTDNSANNNSSVLQAAGGLNVLGLHQLKKDEDKARIQREYRQVLDMQAAEAARKKGNLEDPALLMARRKEVSDQVFAEIMNKEQVKEPVVKKVEAPARNENSAGAPPAFFKQSEEERKRMELDKKKEYAVFLQQQMASAQQQKSQSSDSDQRRRRGGSISYQPHQTSQPENQPSAFQNGNKVFEYQQLPQNLGHASQMPYQQHLPHQPIYHLADQSFSQYPQDQVPQYSQPSQNLQYGQAQPIQAPVLSFPQPQQIVQSQVPSWQTSEGLSKDALRQKQEDYRRDLECQIKLKEDQKQLKQEAKPPRGPQQQPDTFLKQQPFPTEQPNFVRQRTDVSSAGAASGGQDEADRRSRQQQYQEELKRQVEERIRQKEEEKRKIKFEEEAMDRRMQQQQQELAAREQRELQKEGRGAPREERKRNVRRDLFEPSSDNPTAYTANQQPKSQPVEDTYNQPHNWQQPEPKNYPINEIKPVELPLSNRRDDLFVNNQVSYQESQSRYSYDMPPTSSNPFPSSLQVSNYAPQQSSSLIQDQQPPLTASALRTQQFDDEYGKMIGMYQRAFQEIIDFKNQYMEEVMKMRERVIKEREEILEYEKVKHQQSLELQNLRAVYDKLGDMLRPEDTGGRGLNPTVQQNLHSLLIRQQQDVMRMSQTGNKYAQQLAQQQQYQAQTYQNQYYQQQRPSMETQVKQMSNPYDNSHIQDSPNPLEQSLSSDTKFVVVPQQRFGQIIPPQGQTTVTASGQLMQTWTEDTILQQALASKNQAALAQVQNFTSTLAQSLQGSSQLVLGLSQTPQRAMQQLVTTTKLVPRPPTQTFPETIQELPPNQEEDYSSRIHGPSPNDRTQGDAVNTTRTGSQRTQVRPTAIVPTNAPEEDFNSRESSPDRGEAPYNTSNILVEKDQSKLNLADDDSSIIEDQYLIKPRNVPISFVSNPAIINDPMREIDEIMNRNQPASQTKPHQMAVSHPHISLENQTEHGEKRSEIKSITSPVHSVSKTQQKTQERFHNAGVTGSSFYNATMHLQKQQEQTQQEELQKQLLRIYGTSSNPIQQQEYEQPKRDNTPPRAEKDTINQLSFKPSTPGMRMPTSGCDGDQELLMQTNINIANSINEETQKQIIENIAMINKVQAQSKSDHQPMQHKMSSGQSTVVFQNQISRPISIKDQRSFKEEEDFPIEVKMNDEPRQIPILYAGQFEGTNQSNDIWNDPDLVPPPVVTLDGDDYEQDNYFQQPPTDRMQFDYHRHPESHRNHINGNFDIQYRNQFMLPGLSNDNGSLNGGTLKQLKLLSPPSHVDEDDKNSKINLGTYHNDLFNNDLKQNQSIEQPPISQPVVHQARIKSPLKRAPQSAKPQSATGQGRSPQQPQIPKPNLYIPTGLGFDLQPQPTHNERATSSRQGYQRLNTAKSPGSKNNLIVPLQEDQSDRSMSKKERDMLEVVKLIQKAKDTTDSLLGATDQFKFRFKKASGPQEIPEGSQMQIQQSGEETEDDDNEEEVEQPVESDQIMSNIDMIIRNLEEQKGHFVQSSGLFDKVGKSNQREQIQIAVEQEEDDPIEEGNNNGEPSVDPIAALQNESQLEGIRLRSNLQQSSSSRPISGKQAYSIKGSLHEQQNINKQGYQQTQQRSVASAGKYTQMAMNNIKGAVPDEQKLYEEASRKYGAAASSKTRDDYLQVNESNQQVILRPVSSKSNSNRYTANLVASRSKSRSKDRMQASQQLYYEDDEDELQLE